MAKMNCSDEEKYVGKDNNCCERCPAGEHLVEDCNATSKTKCEPCSKGWFTGLKNHLKSCLPCKICVENSFIVSNCTSVKDTVCQCNKGFFSHDEKIEHCERWRECSEGNGVIVQPTATKNTVCAPCESGTYSNVTDYSSPCKPHFRCEDYGLQVKTPGTKTTDAICEPCTSYCNWILPAGLWVGLVLTIVVMATFFFWRAKRRSYRAVTDESSSPVTMVAIVPEPMLAPPEILSHCKESCNNCKLSPFTSDDPSIIHSISDSLSCSIPISPLKPSVSFVEAIQNSSIKEPSSNFFRSCSEPQEDEWCGT